MKQDLITNDKEGAYTPWREDPCTGFPIAYSPRRGHDANDPTTPGATSIAHDKDDDTTVTSPSV
jgi:hypothetical protein